MYAIVISMSLTSKGGLQLVLVMFLLEFLIKNIGNMENKIKFHLTTKMSTHLYRILICIIFVILFQTKNSKQKTLKATKKQVMMMRCAMMSCNEGVPHEHIS